MRGHGRGVPPSKPSMRAHSPLHGGTGRRPVVRLGSPAAARTFLVDPGRRAACVKFLVRDRAEQFTDSCGAVCTAAGRSIVRSPPQAPTGNAACAPMTGTVRRELSGRLLIAGEHHLRRVLGRNTCSTTTPSGRTAPWAGCHGSTSRPATADRPGGAPGPPQAGPPAAAPMTIRPPPDRPWAIPESSRSIVKAASCIRAPQGNGGSNDGQALDLMRLTGASASR